MNFSQNELLELKSLAVTKLRLYENLYNVTSNHKFAGKKSEIDLFADYLDFREPFIENVYQFNKENGGKLKSFEIDLFNEDSLYREICQILLNVDVVYENFCEIDSQNIINMQKVTDDLRDGVKKVKSSRKVRDAYGRSSGLK